MMTKEKRNFFLPVLFIFMFINALAIVFTSALKKHQVDNMVLIVANTLLFLISVISLKMQINGANHANPHAMVRGVMGSVVLKLFVLGTAAFIYLYQAGEQKSINALFASMALYILYTWLEVRIALKIKPGKDGGN